MPFAATLEEIAEARIEFSHVREYVGIEVLRFDRDKQRVRGQSRVRPQGGRDLLCLALLNLGLGRLERVVMGDGQIDGLVQSDAYRSLGACGAKHRKRNQNSSYSAILLLHIPFKMDACPLPPRAATA